MIEGECICNQGASAWPDVGPFAPLPIAEVESEGDVSTQFPWMYEHPLTGSNHRYHDRVQSPNTYTAMMADGPSTPPLSSPLILLFLPVTFPLPFHLAPLYFLHQRIAPLCSISTARIAST